jgi:hypothetical protein
MIFCAKHAIAIDYGEAGSYKFITVTLSVRLDPAYATWPV